MKTRILVFALLLLAATANAATVTAVATNLSGGTGSAFNPITQQLFFTEYSSGELSRYDLGTGILNTIHTGFVGPMGVALHDNYYAYVTTRDGRLFKAAPNSPTHTEVTNGLGMPQQIVIDSPNAMA